jgi:hypothetical protein
VAALPDPGETKVVSADTEWVRGMFSFRGGRRAGRTGHFREVFDAYYAKAVQEGTETSPHILFARCANDAESIIRFTNEWGPLHNPRSGYSQSGFNPEIFTQSELKERDKYFWFTLFWWRSIHKNFKDAIARLSKSESAWKRWQTGQTENAPVFDSTLRFRIVRQQGALAPQVSVGSLIEAFWLMLWLDTAQRAHRIRVCANEACKNAFRTGRADQIYCCQHCKELVNKRKYWTTTGSTRRREQRNRAKSAEKSQTRPTRRRN